MIPDTIKSCVLGALFMTGVLWFTGLVTVPFANAAARAWLEVVMDPASTRFGWWAYQVENVIYAVGRLPLLFACLLAIHIIKTEKGQQP
jgi:uncharacterized membrane protein